MSFEEKIMPKDKYSSIFSESNGDCCVYYPLEIVRNTCNLKLLQDSGIFPSFSWRMFGQVMSLDQ